MKPLTEEQAKAQKSLITQAVYRALKIVRVIVTIENRNFRNVLNSRKGQGNTVASMTIPRKWKPYDRVGIDISKKTGQPRLWVKPGGATIQFVLTTPDGNNQLYYPLGIAFVRISGRHTGNKRRIADLNYDQSKILPRKNTLLVTDSFRDKEGDDHYKFSIIYQRKTDGAIGIIDPPIEHENEH